MLRRLLKYQVKSIIIFSRDEKKQDDLCRDIKDPRVSFLLGDVRQLSDLRFAFQTWITFFMQLPKTSAFLRIFPNKRLGLMREGTRNAALAAIEMGVKNLSY